VKWLRNRDQLTAMLVLLPSLLLLGVFVYGFIAHTATTSLTDWGRDPAQALSQNPIIRYIGLLNYQELFSGLLDQRFRQDLVNNLFFTLFFLIGCLALGLLLALLLDRNPRGEGFFRTIFLFPMALSFIVTGTVWRWMLQPEGGVNAIPSWFGLPAGQFEWLTSRRSVWNFDWNVLPVITALVVAVVLGWIALTAFRNAAPVRGWVASASAAILVLWAAVGGPSLKMLPYAEPKGFNLALIGIIVAAVWQMSGYTMALYLAGLRGVPDELREAARVDGATERQVYTRVIFPMLGPITLSAIIILGHISLKIFDLVFAMTGPDNAQTSVPALNMYLTAFRQNQFSKGAAIGMILLIMVAIVIVPYLASQFRKEAKQ